MAGIEIRKVETEVGETGAGGNRTDTHYVLGGEVDGVFIPFVTKAAGYIEHLVATGKANQPTPTLQPQATQPTPTLQPQGESQGEGSGESQGEGSGDGSGEQ